jgi:5'-3' exonuclease
MLVDAAGLYFRAYYGVPETMTAPDGRPVNAIRGYLDMSAALIERRRPSKYIACLDLDWRPAFRVALVPTYKAHRVAPDGVNEEIPDTLSPQIPLLLNVLRALGIEYTGYVGFEADDVIATLAAREPGPIEVVTGDRDLMALATENDPLYRAGAGEARCARAGRGAGQVRRPREALRRLRRPARRPQRRTARRQGRG